MKKKEEEEQIMEDPNQKWSMKPKKDGAIKKKKTLQNFKDSFKDKFTFDVEEPQVKKNKT